MPRLAHLSRHHALIHQIPATIKQCIFVTRVKSRIRAGLHNINFGPSEKKITKYIWQQHVTMLKC